MRGSVRGKIAVLVLAAVALGVVFGPVVQVYAAAPDHRYYRCRHHYQYWYFGGRWLYSYRYYYYPYTYPYYSYSYPSYYSHYVDPQLTVNTDPPSLSTQVKGGGSYNQGSSASFAALQSLVQVSQDTRYIFSHWGGDYSGTDLVGTVTMDSAKTVTAIYEKQYYCSVSSNALSPEGTGWYNEGDTFSVTVPSQVDGNGGRRFVFDRWVIDGANGQTGTALSVEMNAPHRIVAQYKQQFYLKLVTDQGVPSGEGWYDANTDAQISVSTPESPRYGVKIVFNGWQGDVQYASQSTRVLMNGPKTVTATWRTDATLLYQTILGLCLAAAVIVALIIAYAVGGGRGKEIVVAKPENKAAVKSEIVEPASVQPLGALAVSQGASRSRKYCVACGNQFPRSSKFCPECGAKRL